MRIRPKDVPEVAVAMRHLRVIVAELATLQALTERQRRALRHWVRTGGEIVFISANAPEIRQNLLAAELIRPSEVEDESDDTTAGGDGEPRRVFTGYGRRQPAGLGMVHIVSPGLADSNGLYLGTAFERIFSRRSVFPTQALHDVSLENAALGDLYNSELQAAVRARLDANIDESFPLWAYLLIVALSTAVLLVVVRRWSKGGRPVIQLFATCGVAAMASCVLIYGLAHAARGDGNRYRSMSWIEVASGETDGAMWRRVALAMDRPGVHTYAVPSDDMLITAPRADLREHDERAELSITGRRWETILAAEQGVVELDGAVTIEEDRSENLFIVRNGLSVDIEGAHAVIRGNWYEIGPVRSGQSVELQPSNENRCRAPSLFLPDVWTRLNAVSQRNTTALVGEIDIGCPDRGSFRGDGCHTSLVVWRVP
jgi:hypothetical protein